MVSREPEAKRSWTAIWLSTLGIPGRRGHELIAAGTVVLDGEGEIPRFSLPPPRPQHFLCQDFWRYRSLFEKVLKENVCKALSVLGEGLFGRKHSKNGGEEGAFKDGLGDCFYGGMKTVDFHSGSKASSMHGAGEVQLGECLNGI